MLLQEIQRDTPENLDFNQSNDSLYIRHHVKSVISNFRSNFSKKIAYLIYLKDRVWRECKLEELINALQNGNQKVHRVENSRISSLRSRNIETIEYSIMNFKIRLNMYNDFLLSCNVVDFRL